MPSDSTMPTQGMVHCTKCGHLMHQSARACPECGAPSFASSAQGVSPKSRLVALLLCIFLGGLGIHRFYVGKTGTGILWLLTVGLLGIGALVDLIMIAAGSFRDSNGLAILDWEARG
jgi:TM2 domain